MTGKKKLSTLPLQEALEEEEKILVDPLALRKKKKRSSFSSSPSERSSSSGEKRRKWSLLEAFGTLFLAGDDGQRNGGGES